MVIKVSVINCRVFNSSSGVSLIINEIIVVRKRIEDVVEIIFDTELNERLISKKVKSIDGFHNTRDEIAIKCLQ